MARICENCENNYKPTCMRVNVKYGKALDGKVYILRTYPGDKESCGHYVEKEETNASS